MPYEAYSGMAEEDLKALIAYLKTLKPVKKATPELESRAPLTRSLGIPTYLKVFGRFSNSPPFTCLSIFNSACGRRSSVN